MGEDVGADETVTASYRLRETIQGAVLTKEITLRAGQPLVYQRHVFEGGHGSISAAHHVMLHVPGGARLSFSRKSGGDTPSAGLETDPARGRVVLAYPQHFAELSSVRRNDGSTVEASVYPFDHDHEDQVVLSEAPGTGIGWSAAVAVTDGFLFFAIKDAAKLPQTVLWMSNGGRFYPPWNGRHQAVLGIEEAVTGLHLSGAPGSATTPPTALDLAEGRRIEVRYAFGAIAVPAGWSRVAAIAVAGDAVMLTDVGGESRTLPFRGSHFDGGLTVMMPPAVRARGRPPLA
jgi:hypothetical protein